MRQLRAGGHRPWAGWRCTATSLSRSDVKYVSQEGFEPTTKGLRVPCSTAELLALTKE